MQNMSVGAMKFGDEEDFKLAIAELKWIGKYFGRVKDKDFETVASKYNFPVDFLKKGLAGLKHPDDYKISKSDWFPILFSWVCQHGQMSDKLFRLRIDYESFKFSMLMTFAVLVGIFQVIGIFLHVYMGLDSLNLALLIISFALAAIGLFFEMRNPLMEKRHALDEIKSFLEEKNMHTIIKGCDGLVKQNYKFIVYAPNIMKEKMKSALKMTIFSFHVENKTLYLDDWEDSVAEYQRRISELNSNTQDSETNET